MARLPAGRRHRGTQCLPQVSPAHGPGPQTASSRRCVRRAAPLRTPLPHGSPWKAALTLPAEPEETPRFVLGPAFKPNPCRHVGYNLSLRPSDTGRPPNRTNAAQHGGPTPGTRPGTPARPRSEKPGPRPAGARRALPLPRPPRTHPPPSPSCRTPWPPPRRPGRAASAALSQSRLT